MDDVQSGAARDSRPPDGEVLQLAADLLEREAVALRRRSIGEVGDDENLDGLGELHQALRSAYARTFPFSLTGDLLTLKDNQGLTAEDAIWVRHHLAAALDEMAEIRHVLAERARARS